MRSCPSGASLAGLARHARPTVFRRHAAHAAGANQAITAMPFDIYIANWLYSDMAMHSRRTETLNRAFSALADPTRRAIIDRLVAGEATVSQLMEPFKLSQPTISKHLKVLEEAGLIEQGRDAQRRPRKLVFVGLKEVADWIDPFRAQWERRLNNLDNYLATSKAKGK
jgi:DNA-binding transcriptional ArsR family regulator